MKLCRSGSNPEFVVRAFLPVVPDEGVGHARLVAGEALDPWLAVHIRPAAEAADVALGALHAGMSLSIHRFGNGVEIRVNDRRAVEPDLYLRA